MCKSALQIYWKTQLLPAKLNYLEYVKQFFTSIALPHSLFVIGGIPLIPKLYFGGLPFKNKPVLIFEISESWVILSVTVLKNAI